MTCGRSGSTASDSSENATGSRFRCCRSPSGVRGSRPTSSSAARAVGRTASGRTGARSSTATHRRNGSTAGTTTSADRPSAAARLGLRLLDPYLRAFDRRAARSADTYIANSTYVREQIWAAYGIDAEVLHPPASLDPDGPAEAVPGIEPGFLLTVARLLPYKHVAETVGAFRLLPEQRLVVVGEGPEAAALRSSLPGNVRLLGEVSDARLRWLYAHCVGLVAASREDFGLTPVEAASFGKPVAALRWGGYLDTVVPDVTGVLFERPTHSEIAEGVQRILELEWREDAIRAHAATFSEERFAARLTQIVS